MPWHNNPLIGRRRRAALLRIRSDSSKARSTHPDRCRERRNSCRSRDPRPSAGYSRWRPRRVQDGTPRRQYSGHSDPATSSAACPRVHPSRMVFSPGAERRSCRGLRDASPAMRQWDHNRRRRSAGWRRARRLHHAEQPDCRRYKNPPEYRREAGLSWSFRSPWA